MKEIEILVEVYTPFGKAIEVLEENFKYTGKKHIIDTYYFDPLRPVLKPNNNNQLLHCLRLRNQNNTYYVTYKDDIFEGDNWLYSEELNTKIQSLNDIKLIFKKLGLKKLITINNTRYIYKFGNYEIVLENVKNLGIFLEVEYCTKENINIHNKKIEIQKFIDNLGLKVSKETTAGKPQLLLNKKGINIK